jgi:hypothetical protein
LSLFGLQGLLLFPLFGLLLLSLFGLQGLLLFPLFGLLLLSLFGLQGLLLFPLFGFLFLGLIGLFAGFFSLCRISDSARKGLSLQYLELYRIYLGSLFFQLFIKY